MTSPFLDKSTNAKPVYIVGDQAFVSLSDNLATLAPGSSTIPVVLTTSGVFAFTVVMSGTSPSLKLQQLGPDGSTWIDVLPTPLTANGSTSVEVMAGTAGAAVRLTNGGTNPITGLTAALVA